MLRSMAHGFGWMIGALAATVLVIGVLLGIVALGVWFGSGQ